MKESTTEKWEITVVVWEVAIGVRKIADGQPPCGKPETAGKQNRKTKHIGKIEVLDGNKAIITKLTPKTKQKNNTKRNKKEEEKRKKKTTKNFTYKTKNVTIRYF
jgi:hypothetical protein